MQPGWAREGRGVVKRSVRTPSTTPNIDSCNCNHHSRFLTQRPASLTHLGVVHAAAPVKSQVDLARVDQRGRVHGTAAVRLAVLVHPVKHRTAGREGADRAARAHALKNPKQAPPGRARAPHRPAIAPSHTL